jgi:hypothetical protein
VAGGPGRVAGIERHCAAVSGGRLLVAPERGGGRRHQRHALPRLSGRSVQPDRARRAGVRGAHLAQGQLGGGADLQEGGALAVEARVVEPDVGEVDGAPGMTARQRGARAPGQRRRRRGRRRPAPRHQNVPSDGEPVYGTKVMLLPARARML